MELGTRRRCCIPALVTTTLGSLRCADLYREALRAGRALNQEPAQTREGVNKYLRLSGEAFEAALRQPFAKADRIDLAKSAFSSVMECKLLSLGEKLGALERYRGYLPVGSARLVAAACAEFVTQANGAQEKLPKGAFVGIAALLESGFLSSQSRRMIARALLASFESSPADIGLEILEGAVAASRGSVPEFRVLQLKLALSSVQKASSLDGLARFKCLASGFNLVSDNSVRRGQALSETIFEMLRGQLPSLSPAERVLALRDIIPMTLARRKEVRKELSSLVDKLEGEGVGHAQAEELRRGLSAMWMHPFSIHAF